MKRVYVNEDRRLCKYCCGLSNSGMTNMVKAINPIRIEEGPR